MSHDLNLINANYVSYLGPLSSIKNDNQTRLQHFSFEASSISNQNLKFMKTTEHNFNQNYIKYSQRPIQQVDEALNQNHQALKNLIEMIDNRKTKSTITGLTFNKNKDFERTNRFSRKSNEEVKREKKNFVQDLKQVKQKMNEIMRLIDIKIKVNQQQTQYSNTLADLDFIKEKLSVQSAKLDILQRDNTERIQIYLPKSQDQSNFKHQYIINNSHQKTIENYDNIIEKAQDQQYLHLKHSFDKLNDDSAQLTTNHNSKKQTEVIQTLVHNKLNQNNVVDFFTKEKRDQRKKSVQFSSKKSQTHYSPQFSQVTYKEEIEVKKNMNIKPKFTQILQPRFKQPLVQQTKYLERSKSVDSKPPSHPNNQIKIVYKPFNPSLKDSNISNRFSSNQNRFYNPNSFGRPTSKIVIYPNTQAISISAMPLVNRSPISHFSPPLTDFKSPPIPYRSQQKAIIKQWDEQSRHDQSFGLSSSISNHKNAQNSTNLKKSSRNTQKFSFIQHFANNPDARKRRQESLVQNQQAKQSIVQYGFPQIIPRQQNVTMQNPFQEWNNLFHMEKSNRRQEIRMNDNSMKTMIQTSEHKNKDSIIHQASFFDSSKSGSKPSKIIMPPIQLMEGGSGYKKKKKGLEVSKRMNQTGYIPKY